MVRQFFVGGNFKMNPASVDKKKGIIDILNNADLDSSTEVIIAPPSLYLIPLRDTIRKDIKLAAQNCYCKDSGAFTGEISPAQLTDIKIPYVILGHSERRTLFHETSELVGEKTKAALDAHLKVILCVGETLAQREAGKTTEVVFTQLQAVKDILQKTTYWNGDIVIAYEPVWAIGTGKVATPAQAQEAHDKIRSFLKMEVNFGASEVTRIIYGGSVNAANCKELAVQPDIDGFLVGGASLKPEFVDIINVNRQ